MSGLEKLKKQISEMRLGKKGSRRRPHKLVMLLAVLDMFDRGVLRDNRIYFDDQLKEAFSRVFERYSRGDDLDQPSQPFFHLRSSGFWHHKIKNGKEMSYSLLSTSGGGERRIQEHIEYAYFDHNAFSVVQNSDTRGALAAFIRELLGERTMNRLGAAFHESFALSRSAITQVVRLAWYTNGSFSREQLREHSNLGKNYVKAMPRYAVGTGLLEEKTYKLTPFGRVVFERDPDLNHPSTQWLMHYHLSATNGPGPLFWHYLVSQKLRFGVRLDPDDLRGSVQAYLKEIDGIGLADRSARTLITVFIGTYTKVEGLGKLGVLEEIEEEQGEKSYLVQETDPPSPGALGYALAHYWESLWGGANVVPLSELSKPGGFADLFFLDAFQLNPILRELQSRGLLSLWQIASPHQVSRGWEQKEVFLDLLYE